MYKRLKISLCKNFDKGSNIYLFSFDKNEPSSQNPYMKICG